MRPLLLACLLLAGCSGRQTVSPYEAAHSSSRHAYATPIYSAPIEVVQRAVVRACMGYYHHVDVYDKEAHRILVKNRNLWAGSSDVTITLETNADGETVVNIASEGVGMQAMSAAGRTDRDLQEIIRRLADEMRVADAYETTNPGG
jgi:hypothetical protein